MVADYDNRYTVVCRICEKEVTLKQLELHSEDCLQQNKVS